jgi:hypothetical protein
MNTSTPPVSPPLPAPVSPLPPRELQRVVIGWGDAPTPTDGFVEVHSIAADWTKGAETPYIAVYGVVEGDSGEPVVDSNMFVGDRNDDFSSPSSALRDALRGVDLTKFNRDDVKVPAAGWLYIHPLDDAESDPYVVPADAYPELKAATTALYKAVVESGKSAGH